MSMNVKLPNFSKCNKIKEKKKKLQLTIHVCNQATRSLHCRWPTNQTDKQINTFVDA